MFAQHLERLIISRTLDEARAGYVAAMSAYGFRHAFYAARFHLPLPAAVLRENPVVFSSFPPEFTAVVMQPDFLAATPCAAWALRHSGDAALADFDAAPVMAPATGATCAATLALAAMHRVEAGRVISLKDRVLRSHGAAVLNPHAGASHHEAEALWRSNGRAVNLLTWALHLRVATLRLERRDAILTQRQREVLEWSSAGKTVSEIAMILGLTGATVEKHLRLARRALGADTTAHAVLKAHVTWQIFAHDPQANPFV